MIINHLKKMHEMCKKTEEQIEKAIEVPDFSEKNKKIRREQYKQYENSKPKMLVHSTTIHSMKRSAENNWIDPSRGVLVNDIYGNQSDSKPARGVFMSDYNENGHGYYSLEQLRRRLGRSPTKDEFLKNAAIAYIDPNDRDHSNIIHLPNEQKNFPNDDRNRYIKPWANNPESKAITHGEYAKPEKYIHVEPGDYFSQAGVKPHKWLHGEELHQDILQNPEKYHKDVVSLVHEKPTDKMPGNIDSNSVQKSNDSSQFNLLQYINKLDPSAGESYKGYKMSVQHLKKMHKMCKGMPVDQAVEEIKGPAKVNEVIPKVDADKRAEVFNQLRMEKATEPSLEKQSMSVSGARPGAEMSPSMVQTSSQTAMAKNEEMEKSAEQAKNPAFLKKPKEGTVSGEHPESDLVGDYSKRMGEQKSVNDKPVQKQGFGSAQALKGAIKALRSNKKNG